MQGPVIKLAKELGFFTIVLDGSLQAPCISMADQFEQIDLKNKEEIETFARFTQNSRRTFGNNDRRNGFFRQCGLGR